MPAFNFSGLGGGNSSTDYSYLTTQLQIKENQLAQDGKLSPGDYDLLTKMARAAYSHPGLTPDQRNQIGVKISGYQKDKSQSDIAHGSNVSNLNAEVQDDMSKNSMIFGNNPEKFLQANADTLRAKINQLSDAIDTANNAGDDSAALENEYAKTLSDFNDTTAAISDVKTYQTGSKPNTDFAAYVVTNSKGEISSVKIGRLGSESGYVETNGVFGGLPLYGKVNQKQDGKNVFKIGNNTFSASDYSIPDPANPGAMKANPLVSTDQQIGSGFKGAQAGQVKVLDLTQIPTQQAIATGQWAKGKSGAYYKRADDGSYTKYVNTDPTKLGVDPSSILNVPSSFEKRVLLPFAKNTVDGAAPASAPLPPTLAPNVTNNSSTPSGSQTSTPPIAPQSSSQGPSSSPASVSRTQAPTERAPTSFAGIAKNALESAGSFLGNLFKGGK